MNHSHWHSLEYVDERLRELQGFLRGILLDGEISQAEMRALRAWVQHHAHSLEKEHPFSEILPYLRTLLADSRITQNDLREELTWMWERLRTIQLRHPSSFSDLTVFLGLVRGVLADELLHPSEIDHLVRWLERCPGRNCEGMDDSPFPHIREVLLHYRRQEAYDPEFLNLRQYLEYMVELVVAA